MARAKDIPTVLTAPCGDGHHRSLRDMTPTELADREARQRAYEQMLARQQAFEKNRERPHQIEPPSRAGCVFTKSCHLPNGVINHQSPMGFIPTDSLEDYGNYALLGGRELNSFGQLPLRTIGGEPPAGIGSLALAGAALTSAMPMEAGAFGASGILASGVAAGALLGLVALLTPSKLGDSALYTEKQLGLLEQARTRVRLRVEQNSEGTLKGYGYNTQSRRDW